MRFASKYVLPLFLLLALLIGCGPKSDEILDVDTAPATEIATTTEEPIATDEASSPAAADLVTAPSEPVAQVVQPSGGEIVVDDPESPIDGLTIAVPAGAYTDSTEFVVSCHPFEGTAPDNVSPISPVIEIENGGTYADEIITVTVPIQLPDDHFAMGFFLHEDGSLEGLPVVELTENSITVATLHFSSFFISMIADSLLTGRFDTGFRAGVDDWQFDNYGSYIAPRGHCAGQCLAAIWYYYERALHGAPHLYGLYDNNGDNKTPNLWEDDSDAYRLCSVAQHDYQNSPLGNRILRGLHTAALGSDEDNWRAFLYAMLITGEPQLVAIRNEDSGHAMIAFAANADTGALLVADPNFHGDTSIIRHAAGTFSPYVTGNSKADIEAGETISYNQIRYLAKSALVFWNQLAARWSEFDAGTIGDDVFPAYQLVYWDPNTAEYNPLPDSMPFSGDRIYIAASFGGQIEPVYVVGATGEAIEKDTEFNVPLATGENNLGVGIDRTVAERSKYVDFQWIHVERIEAEIQVKIEVQVHANIHRVDVPDPSTGFEGQTTDHDTPFEKLVIVGADALVAGDQYSASWSNVPNDEGDGLHAGRLAVVLGPERSEVLSFRGIDVLTLDSGTTATSATSGSHVPVAEGAAGILEFSLRGADTANHLTVFTHNWAFSEGNTREATGFTGDEYSLIRITIE